MKSAVVLLLGKGVEEVFNTEYWKRSEVGESAVLFVEVEWSMQKGFCLVWLRVSLSLSMQNTTQ